MVHYMAEKVQSTQTIKKSTFHNIATFHTTILTQVAVTCYRPEDTLGVNEMLYKISFQEIFEFPMNLISML